MKVLFLDESGDHNLSLIDPQYPMFVLGGVIVDKDYADGPLTEQLNAFKTSFFGRSDIVRAKNDNIAGLQLADLVVSPIGRRVLGKPRRRTGESWRRNFGAAQMAGWRAMVWSSCRNKTGRPPLRSDQPTVAIWGEGA